MLNLSMGYINSNICTLNYIFCHRLPLGVFIAAGLLFSD